VCYYATNTKSSQAKLPTGKWVDRDSFLDAINIYIKTCAHKMPSHDLPILDRASCFLISQAQRISTTVTLLYDPSSTFLYRDEEEWHPAPIPDWTLGFFLAATKQPHAAAKLEVRGARDVYNAV